MPITVTLSQQQLWMERYPLMEMCARKKPLFPEIDIDIKGLNEYQKYKMFLSIKRDGDTRYSFDNDQWIVSESRRSKPFHNSKEIEHSSGIQTGSYWMSKSVKYSKVKISYHDKDKDLDNVFYCQTMHKYKPIITILNMDSNEKETFVLEYAQFIAVSDYFPSGIGQWKSQNNKYTTKRHGGLGKRKHVNEEKEDGPSNKKVSKKETALTENNSYGNIKLDAPMTSSSALEMLQIPIDNLPPLPIFDPYYPSIQLPPLNPNNQFYNSNNTYPIPFFDYNQQFQCFPHNIPNTQPSFSNNSFQLFPNPPFIPFENIPPTPFY